MEQTKQELAEEKYQASRCELVNALDGFIMDCAGKGCVGMHTDTEAEIDGLVKSTLKAWDNNVHPTMGNILKDFQKVHAGVQSQQKNPDPNWHWELGLNVAYSYSPAQREIINPPDDAQEGIDASITIDVIEFRGIDITKKFTKAELEDMAIEIMDELEAAE